MSPSLVEMRRGKKIFLQSVICGANYRLTDKFSFEPMRYNC
jgi:hypothetical protein